MSKSIEEKFKELTDPEVFKLIKDIGENRTGDVFNDYIFAFEKFKNFTVEQKLEFIFQQLYLK